MSARDLVRSGIRRLSNPTGRWFVVAVLLTTTLLVLAACGGSK